MTATTDTSAMRRVADEAALLAKRLPHSVLEAVAEAIALAERPDLASLRVRALEGLAHPHYRSVVAAFLDACLAGAADIAPSAVGVALLTAAGAEKANREQQTVELVWTGPDMGVVPVRRTEQAILQVIESAARQLTVVSYAVYRIPRIAAALLRAADRNVAIKIIVENPDRHEGQNAYDTLLALGPSVARACRVYHWPLEKRTKDERGKAGILHVKCAVADERHLFLSSANLTEQAFTLNMELGLLVTGGNLPAQIARQFDQLIQTGILAAATNQ